MYLISFILWDSHDLNTCLLSIWLGLNLLQVPNHLIIYKRGNALISRFLSGYSEATTHNEGPRSDRNLIIRPLGTEKCLISSEQGGLLWHERGSYWKCLFIIWGPPRETNIGTFPFFPGTTSGRAQNSRNKCLGDPTRRLVTYHGFRNRFEIKLTSAIRPSRY